MEIFQHKNEIDHAYINNLNKFLQNDTLLSQESQNIYIIDNNQTSQILGTNDMNYHKNYLYLLLFSIVAFFILGYYLYYIAKSNLKRLKSTNTESAALMTKFSNTKKLSYAIFGMILIISYSQSYQLSLYRLNIQQKF